ncbi:hypothetical protein GIB67_041881 [Kingdonia uniflora]|uniref:Dual specificity protein phosphatase PHS1 n=1 Tax=Kingdonia uniflora TaxID=39325 RepID=A0A7J7L624_9MAGN|nr:hypothetical protein GIB67_041881 [Kingdonia uniflora]
MAHQKEPSPPLHHLQEEKHEEDDKDLKGESEVLYLLGDVTAGPAYRFSQWLESVRSRSGKYRSPRFFDRSPTLGTMALRSVQENRLQNQQAHNVPTKLQRSACGNDLVNVLRWTSYRVTVNSGGVVFFALFGKPLSDDSSPKESAVVIKIASSRMATQSERLGYEFAKMLGVRTPQARVVHNFSPEWQQIKDATEKAKDAAIVVGDDVGELTCSELLEALELSKCLFLMNYIHGSPILENSSAFCLEENAKRTAASLGRILMLDLVIRNEDRLPCRQLGWRGNCANLFFADKVASKETHEIAETFDSRTRRYRPRVIRTLRKERRASSVDGRLNRCRPDLISQSSDISDISPKSINLENKPLDESEPDKYDIIAIDSGIPRRPPVGKRANDHSNYPKLVELLLNSHDYSSSLLYDITWGKLGISLSEEVNGKIDSCSLDFNKIVNEFRGEFREALGDLQGFHILLLTLHQKLDSLLRVFLTIIDKNSSVDDDSGGISESPSNAGGVGVHFFSTSSKERVNENLADLSDPELQKTAPKSSPPRSKDSPDGSSPISRENWHGRYSKGNGELLRSLRLTAKLRDFNRYAKADIELNKELELWNEMLKTDVIKLCQEKNFNTGFFEGNENNSVFDAYELKVRLEHILERIALISDAGNTERPSSISTSLFIGGALAARSVYTLQHLGITHILCLCSNEIGQSDSQLPELFQYKNFAVSSSTLLFMLISDNEDTKISDLFEEACNFVENAEHSGGRVLVHCFEGRSRSATLVLAYLMLRKHMTLLEAHDTLLRVHRRARPNQGFAKALSNLDKELYGKVSLDLQQLHQRRPMMKVCPICEKNVGLTSCSLKQHLQKSHRKLSSGSVDSAMNMEIQKVLSSLKIMRGGSVSPTHKQSHSNPFDN